MSQEKLSSFLSVEMTTVETQQCKLLPLCVSFRVPGIPVNWETLTGELRV